MDEKVYGELIVSINSASQRLPLEISDKLFKNNRMEKVLSLKNCAKLGLGLVLSKHLCTQMGGWLKMKKQRNGGFVY